MACSWTCSGVGGGAGAVTAAGLAAVRRGACLGAVTVICGIGLALGGTTVGDGWPASCADAAPTKIATAEPPSNNSFRTDLIMFLYPPGIETESTCVIWTTDVALMRESIALQP